MMKAILGSKVAVRWSTASGSWQTWADKPSASESSCFKLSVKVGASCARHVNEAGLQVLGSHLFQRLINLQLTALRPELAVFRIQTVTVAERSD